MAAYSASYYSEFGNYSDHRAGQRHEEGDPEEGWTNVFLMENVQGTKGGCPWGSIVRGLASFGLDMEKPTL